MKLTEHIFVIGFMGCGKSTNGLCLARLAGTERLEMDEMIVKEQGMEISDLFAQYGETYFRDLETKLIGSLREHRPSVISCGGGAVLREENTAMMKSMGKIVLLTASPMTIYHRVKDSTSRPVLNGHMNPDDIRKLMEIRRPRYEAAADLIISTDGKSVEEICREILCQMNSQ